MEIKKEDLVFIRGEGGELLSQEVTLENIEGNPTIRAKPLTRGMLQEIYQRATSDNPAEKIRADNDVIINGLVSPALTEAEIADMKPQLALAVTQGILSISLGISQKDIGEKTKDIIEDQEYLLAKK